MAAASAAQLGALPLAQWHAGVGAVGLVVAVALGATLLVSILRRTAQDDVLSQIRKIRRAIDTAAEGILTVGPDARILEANRTACDRLEYAREELLRLSIPDIDPDFPMERWPGHWDALRENGQSVIETVHVTKSGRRIPVEVTIKYYREGQEEFACSFLRDMTAQRQAEAQLREANTRLEDRVQERTAELEHALERLQTAQEQVARRERLNALAELSRGIAHDLNNSLMPIVAQCQLIQLVDMPEAERQKAQELILNSANHAADVVRRLQSLYRTPADEESPVELNLVDIIKSSQELTRPLWHDESAQTGRTINIRIELDDCVPIEGDPSSLQRLFTQLIINGVKAIEGDGEIVFRGQVHDDTTRIHVCDNGVGMNEVQREHCFEPLFTTTRQGHGMGLNMCQHIVHQHGGTIEIASVVNEGTTITVCFPTPTPVSVADHAAPDVTALKPVHILCIDDDEIVRDAVMALLEALGARVTAAEDGKSGLSKLDQTPFDMVITDLGMQGMSGRDVVKRVREQHPGVPVAVLSGWSRGDVERCFAGQEPPDEIVQKPVTLQALRALVERCTPVSTG